MQKEVPLNDDAFDVLSFLSGYGFWLLLAVALVILVVYKKLKK